MLRFLLTLMVLIASQASADDMLNNGGIFNKGLLISEVDGSPAGKVKTVYVTNDSLTLNSDGTATLNISSGGGNWGSITGTLSNQTDLQTALNLKASTSSLGWQDGGTNIYLTTTTDTVGIGTTSANATTLEIVKQTSTPPIKISSSASGNGDYLIMTSAGNVGIGTNSPHGPFNVKSGSNQVIRFFGTGSNTNSTSVGVRALGSNDAPTIGTDNTAVGSEALFTYNASSGSNTAVGSQASYSNTNGQNNVAVGYDTIYRGSATGNTAIGAGAMLGNSSGAGNNNVAVGYNAGTNINAGTNNILLGYSAASNLSSGSNNIMLGYNMQLPSNTASNQLNIGNIIYGTNVNGSGATISGANIGIGTTAPLGGLIVMNGNVGVGTWSPTNKLQVIGNIQATSFVKSGGVSSEFLKADGSSDPTVYGTGTLTGTGTDDSLARWVSGSLIDSSVYSDGSNAWVGNGLSVNANIFNNGILEVMSGSSGGARSFYVGTNNDIVTTRYNTLDTGDGSVSMGGSSGDILTVGTTTDYGLGIQVSQNGPALIRIKQKDASAHDGIWSFDAEANDLYWGTSSQNYAQIKRDNALGGVWAFNIMYGIIDSYSTISVLSSSVGIRTGASTPPSMLSLAGNMSIGATYGTTNAAPTDGLIVQGNVGIGTVIPGQKLEVVGTIKTSQLIDTGATASTYAYFNASKQISSATLGTGLANSSGTLNSNAVSFVTYQPGLLTAVNATIGVNYKFSKTSTVDNLIGSAVTFSCIANPTVTMYECGTSTTCATPTTIGTVTVTAAGTLVAGTVSSSAITAGDYIGWAITAGTCASIDIAATAQVHSN